MENNLSSFVKAGLEEANIGFTGNGGVMNISTGNDFLDQFGKLAKYRALRSYDEVSKDMRLLCSQDLLTAVKFMLYLRTIPRKVTLEDGSKTQLNQVGAELKNEAIMRMYYLGVNHPTVFKTNLSIFVSLGSYKDVFKLMELDYTLNGGGTPAFHMGKRRLDWKFLTGFIAYSLTNKHTSDLCKKYLPKIHSKKNATGKRLASTIVAKYLANKFFKSDANLNAFAEYRKIKASGTAHDWQKAISKKEFNKIEFGLVPGRALNLMASGKFLTNKLLDRKYMAWLETQPVVKYTGYPYELLSPIKTSFYSRKEFRPYQKMTINKQFAQLVAVAREDLADGNNGFLPVIDTSSSMTGIVEGTKVSSYSVALSMGLFFSHVLKSEKFGMSWIEFNNEAKLKTWKGDNPFDQYFNSHDEAYGSTNLTSTAILFVKLLKQGVPESDFPSGVICISDGEFDVTGSVSSYKFLLDTLREGGFSEEFVSKFKIVFWDIPNGYYGKKGSGFQTLKDAENVFYMSGFSGAGISFILGRKEIDDTKPQTTPKTPEELFIAAMDQEILNKVRVV